MRALFSRLFVTLPLTSSAPAALLGGLLLLAACSAQRGKTDPQTTDAAQGSGNGGVVQTVEPRASGAASALVVASASTAPPGSAPDAVGQGAVRFRVRGPIEGRIVLERASYAVGEPIFAELTVTNRGTGPLVFDVGGDNFDRPVPLRYNWVVRDGSGAILCDQGRPRPMGGGGRGFKARLAQGETFRETHLLNPVCDALTQSGRYRLSVVRVLTDEDAFETDQVCDALAPPDVTVLGPNAPDPYGERDAACMAKLRDAPAIGVELELELTAYARPTLQARLATLPAERDAAGRAQDRSREAALTIYATWFCSHVRCDCTDEVRWQRADDWFVQALSRVPDAVKCPAAKR